MNRSYVKAVSVIICIALGIALLFSACSKKTSRHSTGNFSGVSSPVAQEQSDENRPQPITRTLAQVVAEIEAYEPPGEAMVDPDVFAMLRDELVAQITRLAKSAGTDRLAAAAPTGDSGRVTDLAYDPGSDMLTWSYANVGDYDLSGEVGISDITPIAQNYLANTTDGVGNDEYEAWVDGDDSGEVGISDITPIASNYLNDVKEYRILTSAYPDSGFATLGDPVPYGEQGEFPKAYSVVLPDGASAYMAVEPVGADLAPGERSDVISLIGEPIIASVEPTSGLEFASVMFSASVSGEEPFTYAWDFGGGTDPETSTEESPTVSLGSMGTYDASLTVTNDYGQDTFDFTLSVTKLVNENLVPVAQAWPLVGDAPLTVALVSNGSYNLTGEIVLYEWDFESDGVYDYSQALPYNVEHEYEGGTWRATLRITDENGATAAAVTPEITALAENPNWTFEKLFDWEYGGEPEYITLNIDPDTGLPILTYLKDRKFKMTFKNEDMEWETDYWGLWTGDSVKDVSNAVIYGDSSIFQVVRKDNSQTGDKLLYVLRRFPDGDWDDTVVLESDYSSSTPRPKLALDPEGRIGLIYPCSGGMVKYALFDGVSWNYEPMDFEYTWPWFAGFGYRGDTPCAVRAWDTITVFEKQEDSWNPTIVGIPDPGDTFENTLCSSSGESLYICATELNSQKTWIWQNTDDLWLKDKLYNTGGALLAKPQAIASNENMAAVALYINDFPGYYLVLAYGTNGDWQYELILSGDVRIISNSMVITDDNSIWIAYTADLDADTLYVATRTPIEE